MSYQHGIYIDEASESSPELLKNTDGVQVVIGTAPVTSGNSANVNVPVVANNYNEAVSQVGYSDDWDKYTLSQSIYATFNVFKVAPLVLINVLDPTKHTSTASKEATIAEGKAIVDDKGIVLKSIIVTSVNSPGTKYVQDKDYSVNITSDGKVELDVIQAGAITETSVDVSYSIIDATKVTAEDVISGMDAIKQIYPRFNLVPGLIIAPGWSQNPEVEKALKQHNAAINGCFNAEILTDIDTKTVKTKEAAEKFKSDNQYVSNREIVCWPMVKKDDRKYYYSAYLAASIAALDAANDNVPYKSPSNKKIDIDSTILDDGTEIFLDITEANELNGSGIVTAINMAGWRTWGNNTGAYPENTSEEDRWIPIRRVFDWWGNNFIIDFFDKVDDPTNYRLIESIVDEENIKANGYQAAGKISGAKITFNQADNSKDAILNGNIVFRQSLGAFIPAENIINVLEFDPSYATSILSSQGGGK